MKNQFTNALLVLLGILICNPLFAQEAIAAEVEAELTEGTSTEALVVVEVTPDTAAVQPLRVSPDEAVKRAIENNLSLQSAQVTTSTKKRASDLSWNQFIPNVTLAGGLSVDNEKTTASGMAPLDKIPLNPLYMGMLPPEVPEFYGVVPYSVDVPRSHLIGNISVSLNFSYAMIENMTRLKLDYQGGLIAYDKAKLQLERDVRKAYNNMLLLQENIGLLRESYEAANRRVAMARANYNAGLVPELSLLQAQVAVENMKPTIDQVENGYRLSLAQFAMFLGMPYDTAFELVPVETNPDGDAASFISLDIKEMISKAAAGKPDIRELRQTILMMQSARKAQIYSLLPALSLSWDSRSVFIGDLEKDKWDDKDLWNKSGSFTIMLALQLHSLIPFSQNFQGIKNMDDQIRTATIGLSQLIQGTEIEIYNTVLALNKTQLTAEAHQQTINMAERAYRLTEEAYRAGLQDLLQVQSAELELKQARVSMLEQQFNYLNGLIDLEYSIGVPFGTLSKESK